MENMTSAQLAQLLYVAYYGRPADPAGLEFWTAQIDEVGVEGIAADFGTSAEFDARFGDLGSVALVNNLYQQLFGRDAEAEGLQYWLDVLAEGTPLASIALEIANGAQGGDATGLQNKVTLAGQFTAAVAAGSVVYEGEAAANYGRDFLATINENTNVEAYDVQAVVDAIESGELPVDTADLRAGLEDLREAEAALETFLVNSLENEGVAAIAEARDANAETAVAADVTTNYDNAVVDLAGYDADDGITAEFDERSAAAQDALIAETVGNAETAVTEAEAAVADGVIAGLNTVESRTTSYEATIAATATAQTAFEGELARFVAVNDNVDTVDVTVDQNAGTIVITDVNNGDPIATRGENGTWTAVEGVDVSGFTGLTQLLAAGSDLGRAQIAESNALTALENSIVDVVRLEIGNADLAREAALQEATINPVDGDGQVVVDFGGENVADVQALIDARAELETLNGLVEDFLAARDLNVQLNELNTAIEEATDYLTDSEEDGGLGVNLVEGFNAATAGNDVYLFADSEGTENTVASFGQEGIDRIFFGPDYQLVQLAEGESITDRVGSADALEIFWEDTVDGLTLYVEAGAEAGRDLDTDEITSITLTGVTSEDISFTSGFLSAGTATEVA